MSTDEYSNAIRRALIPADQAEALVKLAGWGLAQYGDDFTPADDEAALPLADDIEYVVQQEDAAHPQGTGGFLDYQEAPRFTSPDDEEEGSPARADSFDEAFEDGTEAAPLIEATSLTPQLAALPKNTRFEDLQPMTQDPGLDSLLPFFPDSALQGLTQDVEAAAGPTGQPQEDAEAAEHLSLGKGTEVNNEGLDKDEEPKNGINNPEADPEKEGEQEGELQKKKDVAKRELAKSDDMELGLEGKRQQDTEDEKADLQKGKDAAKQGLSTRAENIELGQETQRQCEDEDEEVDLQNGKEAAAEQEASGMNGTKLRQETKRHREDEDEEVFQDAVAEPMSSQDTTTRQGKSREGKQGVYTVRSREAGASEPAVRPATAVLPRASTARTAAISKRVQAAVRAAEAAREQSSQPGTSSTFTAATALSKNVAALSDSTQLARPLTRSTKASSGEGQAKTVEERPTVAKALDLLKLAERELADSDRGGTEETSVRETRSKKKAGTAQAEQPRELSGLSDSHHAGLSHQDANRVRECEEEVAEQEEARNRALAVSDDNHAKERRMGNGAHGEGKTRQFGGGEAALNEGVNGRREQPDNGTSGRHSNAALPEGEAEAAHTGPGDKQHARMVQGSVLPARLLQRQFTTEAGESRQSGRRKQLGKEAEPILGKRKMESLPEQWKDETLRQETGAVEGSQELEATKEVEDDDMDREGRLLEPRKAWEVIEGTVHGEVMKQHSPELTFIELRKRQRFPTDFADLVNFWPVRKPEQQPPGSISLLSLAVDAGLWSPPPFYRGKRPWIGNQ